MPTIRDSWNQFTWWQKCLSVITLSLVLYALFGFLLLPRIVRFVLVEKVSPVLNRHVSVGDIRLNPFTLTADINNLTISEKNGTGDFVALDGLHADVELSSVFRLALVVREVRVDGPRLHIRLDKDGKTNFADLASAPEDNQPKQQGEAMLLPLIVEPFSLGNGTVIFEDQARGVTHVIDEINFQLPQFSSRKKDWETFMTPTLAFRVNGAPFNLQGQTIPFDNSLKTEFDLNVLDLALSKYWAYAMASENLKLSKGLLNFESKLVFERHEDSLPTFSLKGTITGQDIELTDEGRPVLSAARTEVVMDDISILNLRLGLQSVTLDKPFIRVVRAKDGTLNWMGYFSPGSNANATAPNSKNATDDTEKNATALLLQAPQMRLTNGRIMFQDETLQTSFIKEVEAIDLTITDLNTAENATTQANFSAKTTNGEEFGAEASFSISPVRVTARIHARNLDLPSYSPYFKDALPLTLTSAKADASLGLVIDTSGTTPRLENSKIEIRDLRLDAAGQAGGLNVTRAAIGNIFIDMPGHTIKTGELRIEGAVLSTSVDTEGRARLLGAIQPAAGTAPAPPPSSGQPISWTVQTEGVAISDFRLETGGGPAKEPARVNSLQVGPIILDTGKQSAIVKSVDLSFGLNIFRLKNGAINLVTLFSSDVPAKQNAPIASAPPSSWSAIVEQFSISNSRITLTDEVPPTPVTLDLDQIAFQTKNVTTDLSKAIPLSLSCRVEDVGSIKASGDLIPSTLTTKGSVTLAKIPLSLATAYVKEAANIDITSGVLGGKVDWRLGVQGQEQLGGSIRIDGLRITEGTSKTEIAGLAALELKKIALKLSPLTLAIDQVEVVEPRGAFLIDEKGSTTWDRINPTRSAAKPKEEPKTQTAEASAGITSFDIATISLKQGRFSFADKTLLPQFESVISPLNLTVNGFSLDPSRRTELDLTAIIDGSAPVTAKGWISPLKNPVETNSSVILRNLDLVALSPYSAKFIAYPVASGQLDWDLSVNAEGNNLAMGNAILARKLELGDKVESPGAADVPVKLGLALLRDMSGNIAITLPVKGDLKDPQFNIGGIVMQAFLGLIVKAIASPFSLLASLVPDGGSQDMSKLPFPPGVESPAPESLLNLKRLADVLAQRPGLSIVVSGNAEPVADRKGLADLQFRRKLQIVKYEDLSRKEREKTKPEDLPITDEEYEELLWNAYKDEPVTKEKNAIGLTKEVPREIQEAKLRERIQITDDDLMHLAARRAEFVKNHLVQELKVDANRVFLGSPGPKALAEAPQVVLEVKQ